MTRALVWVAAALTLTAGCRDGEQMDPTVTALPANPSTSDTIGYVLRPDDGEVLAPCREESSADARWVIKADPVNTGSTRLAMGTQTLPAGEMIPIHRHEHQDEILFIHEGRATGILGDSAVQVVPGTTVYVPRGVWHGVRNTETANVNLVWIVAPPGLEGFFRDIGVAPGTKCIPLEAAEMEEIRRKHGVTQRIE